MAKQKPESREPDIDDKADGSRLSLQLDATGAIAWDRMRPSTRATLLDKLRADPQIASAAPAGAAGPGPDLVTAPLAATLFDMLGRVEVAIAMRVYGCSAEQANIFLYSDADKAMLTGPLTKVLNKYGSAWLAKYGDEVALVGLLVAVHAPKVLALQDAFKPAGVVLPFPAGAPVAPAAPTTAPTTAIAAEEP